MGALLLCLAPVSGFLPVTDFDSATFGTYCFVFVGNWGTGSFYQRSIAKGINLFYEDNAGGCPNVRCI